MAAMDDGSGEMDVALNFLVPAPLYLEALALGQLHPDRQSPCLVYVGQHVHPGHRTKSRC